MEIKREDWDYVLECVRRSANMVGDYKNMYDDEKRESEKQFLSRGNEIIETDYANEAQGYPIAVEYPNAACPDDKYITYADYRELRQLYDLAIKQLQEKLKAKGQ